MNNFTSKGCIQAFLFTFLMFFSIHSINLLAQSKDCDTETAFAFLNNDDDPLTADSASSCFIPDFNRWGWTTFLDFSEDSGQSNYTLDIFAGAGQCDLSKGTDVGSVAISFNDDNSVTFNYTLANFVLSEAHIYIGANPYPTNNSGQATVAPGKYTFTDSGFDEVSDYSVTIPVDGKAFYIIVHGVTRSKDCVDTPDDGDCIDSDGDKICDENDICPGFDDSIDTDGDGIPDGCDKDECPDEDGDGICDKDDICPGFDDTIDTDGDGIPDGCDKDECPDEDGDGVCDKDDICPGFDDTIDSNGNGVPDGCESVYQPAHYSIYSKSFSNEIIVQYAFNYDTYIHVEIFDIRGVKVVDIMDTEYIAKNQGSLNIDISKYRNQLLFVCLKTKNSRFTKKIISSSKQQ